MQYQMQFQLIGVLNEQNEFTGIYMIPNNGTRSLPVQHYIVDFPVSELVSNHMLKNIHVKIEFKENENIAKDARIMTEDECKISLEDLRCALSQLPMQYCNI